MSEVEADISRIRFSSSAFPTDEDLALWNSLTPAERRAVVRRDEEAGFASGQAPRESLEERLARVRGREI